MRRSLKLTAALTVCALMLACASAPPKQAYDVLGVTATAVDVAMKSFADLDVAGKIPKATEDKVRAAFTDYQLAMTLAQGAINTWLAAGSPPATFPSTQVGAAVTKAGAIQSLIAAGGK